MWNAATVMYFKKHACRPCMYFEIINKLHAYCNELSRPFCHHNEILTLFLPFIKLLSTWLSANVQALWKPKLQTIWTQIRLLPCISSVYTLFGKEKMIFRQKNTILVENCNLTPLDMYYGLSQVYCIKPKGKIH